MSANIAAVRCCMPYVRTSSTTMSSAWLQRTCISDFSDMQQQARSHCDPSMAEETKSAPPRCCKTKLKITSVITSFHRGDGEEDEERTCFADVPRFWERRSFYMSLESDRGNLD